MPAAPIWMGQLQLGKGASHFSIKYPGACAVTKLYIHSSHVFVDGLHCTTSSVLTDEIAQRAEMDKVSVFLEFRMQSGK